MYNSPKTFAGEKKFSLLEMRLLFYIEIAPKINNIPKTSYHAMR